MDEPSCRVIVRGLPDVLSFNDLYEMIDIFSAFGEAQIQKLGTGYAVLEYRNLEEAQRAVSASKKINLDGHVLVIKKKKAKPTNNNFNYKPNICGENVFNPIYMDLNGTFIQQVREITRTICLEKKDVDAFLLIAADVQKLMQRYWPDCKAVLYGSMTTGLPTITSDVDCFLHIPNNEDSQGHINLRIFQEMNHIFRNVTQGRNIKGPFVRFYHVPTGVYCLLFKNNYLSVYNNRLVKFLLGANKKFIPAALLIKYWAGVNGLSKFEKISSYALMILFIFYLQQELGYIPSVQYLQRNSQVEILINNWNASFVQDYLMLPVYSDTCELPDILGGFFVFYANFNFNEYMICPFLGHIVPKSHFNNPSLLPIVFDKYKINLLSHLMEPLNNRTPIVIQDPLQLNNNLTSLLTVNCAMELQDHFKFAAAVYEEEKNNDFRDFLKKILIKKIWREPIREYRIKETWEKYIEEYPNLERWKSLMIDNFLMILRSTCRIPLYGLYENINEESLKIKQVFVGTIQKAIWERESNTPINFHYFELERDITDRMLSVVNRTFKLEFYVSIWHYEDSGTIHFNVRYSYGDWIDFMEFGTFFEGQVAEWLRISTDRLISDELYRIGFFD